MLFVSNQIDKVYKNLMDAMWKFSSFQEDCLKMMERHKV